ncbi:MAG: D-aminoacyl-tRNA deacylase [Limnochordia bacterium]
MRVLLQRVASASVSVQEDCGRALNQQTIQSGFVALVGVTHEDTFRDAELLAAKVVDLRVFADDEGKMNLSLRDVGGQVLAISQFTLYADCRKGRRPSFTAAAEPDMACELYERFVSELRATGMQVLTGVFGAHMQVMLVNDGPVTILLETEKGNLV